MQQKGEREIMTNGECCRYIRTYSELEGLQHACTLVYCAGYIKKRNEYGGRTGFLWYLSVLRAQTSAILRN